MIVATLILAEADYTQDSEEGRSDTGREIEQALATRTLTAEHCLCLHEQGTSWQIQVNHERKDR